MDLKICHEANYKLSLMLMTLFYGFHAAHGLTCYSCGVTSGGLENCFASISSIAAPSVECHPGITQCLTKVVKEDDGALTLTSRGCHDGSDVAGCRTVDGQTECIALCDTDHCNDPDETVMDTSLLEQANYVIDRKDIMSSEENTAQIVTSVMQTIVDNIIYCYNCRTSIDDEVINEACITDPQADPLTQNVACNLTQGRGCYTTRIEEVETLEFREFARSCGVLSHIPPVGCTSDAFRRTCTTHCLSNFCNTDDGMPPPTPQPGSASRTHYPAPLVLLTLSPMLSLIPRS